MKARVKFNNEIIDVLQVGTKTHLYDIEDIEFLDNPDYWEKLKHQYAGMAMQGMVKTYEQMMRADIECKMDCCEHVDAEVANGVLRSHAEACAEFCSEFATALVNKLKEEYK